MLDNTALTTNQSSSSSNALTSSENGIINKRKRRPAGTPDPDAEVVSLSPKTLLESDQFVCEICNQGFQRDQNLQMHRRRHKVPWKLLKRESPEVAKKRVFVCPERSCLHHHPSHALGDLVGIKKHFRRKHSNNKQWVCEKCLKGYAVQSDYKAHLKTCGTRGHSCDCGRVFSRVESFIEHQDTCTLQQGGPDLPASQLARSSGMASSTSPSSDTNFIIAPLPGIPILPTNTCLLANNEENQRNLELHLSNTCLLGNNEENQATHLKLSIGSSTDSEMNEDSEELKIAMGEKTFADEARQRARKDIELAELEFANARRIRQQALAEIEKAQFVKDEAAKKITSIILQITCNGCKQMSQATRTAAQVYETSFF
ncbi:zinc finger protein SHOOT GRAVITROPISM 5-like [Cornus florida]|uniref:zinc finger protein SHOOT GRAVITROPISM 5-like n=1 Tax=Cornus florida TaxID=4283 RepID=UPI0028998B6E|nr:zinc finger protein SHOOT GRAVITROPISM 5-like [Cornus florida]